MTVGMGCLINTLLLRRDVYMRCSLPGLPSLGKEFSERLLGNIHYHYSKETSSTQFTFQSTDSSNETGDTSVSITPKTSPASTSRASLPRPPTLPHSRTHLIFTMHHLTLSLSLPHLPRQLSSSRSTSPSSPPDSRKSSTSRPSTNREVETDVARWTHMLSLQRQYRCYNSARMAAAVEALERGWRVEDLGVPSRFCLDLLNDGLDQRVRELEGF